MLIIRGPMEGRQDRTGGRACCAHGKDQASPTRDHAPEMHTPQVITKDTYHHIEALSDLAPLHNGAALGIIDACLSQLPKAVNVACFDSQFHSSIPAHVATYPIDQTIARKNGLRKYGFHGISYAFITRSVAKFLNKEEGDVNLIALHLGSGASACDCACALRRAAGG